MQKKPRKVTKEDIEAFEKQYPAYGKTGKVMPEAGREGKIAAGPGAGTGGTVAIILKMLINSIPPNPCIHPALFSLITPSSQSFSCA